MSLIKQLIPSSLKYFTPASQEVNWTRIETLVHGPGAGEDKRIMNSAMFACLKAIASSYREPRLRVFKQVDEGESEKLPDSPLQNLLDNPTPNGELTIKEILFWTSWVENIDGNAYWLKVRSGNADTGNVIQLWPVSPTLMEPATEKDERTGRDRDWISYYKYRIAPNEVIRVPVHNVIHFRLGLDDRDMRKGISPLKALIRQIATDDEADKFVAALLKNYAVPGLVVVPMQGTTLTEEDAERITSKMRLKFGNDNRGNIAVMSKESKIEQFGFSPKDLDMSILHRIPEERISAVLGVPAMIAGLGAGLDRSTYNNSEEAAEWFTERTLIPLWSADEEKLTRSLKPDFSSDKNVYVEFDRNDVRALEEDLNERYTRLKTGTGKPFMTRNEARTEIGLDPVDGWDDEDTAPPEPTPFEGQPASGSQNGREPQDERRSLDLDKWQRKSLKALARGKSPAVKFASDEIPDEQVKSISEQLQSAVTEDDVNAIFETTGEIMPDDYLHELKNTNEYLKRFVEIVSANGK